MDPVIDEILRTRRGDAIRADVMRRWQTHLRDVVQPQLDELNELKAADPPKPEKKGRAA